MRHPELKIIGFVIIGYWNILKTSQLVFGTRSLYDGLGKEKVFVLASHHFSPPPGPLFSRVMTLGCPPWLTHRGNLLVTDCPHPGNPGRVISIFNQHLNQLLQSLVWLNALCSPDRWEPERWQAESFRYFKKWQMSSKGPFFVFSPTFPSTFMWISMDWKGTVYNW